MTDFAESFRVVTFVPEESAQNFIDTISAHIPAFLGNYEKVLWWSEPGTEQFEEKGSGKLERISSVRVEFSLPKDERILAQVIEGVIRPNHPWKEPVILVSVGRIAGKL